MTTVTPAQVRTLAQIEVHGAMHFGDAASVWLGSRVERSTHTASTAALIRHGFLTLDADRVVSITSAGREALANNAFQVEQARLDRRVREQHVAKYTMYSRGNHPIAGWGRAPMGCRVECSCGDLNRRCNEGRRCAEDDFRDHLNRVLTAAGVAGRV